MMYLFRGCWFALREQLREQIHRYKIIDIYKSGQPDFILVTTS